MGTGIAAAKDQTFSGEIMDSLCADMGSHAMRLKGGSYTMLSAGAPHGLGCGLQQNRRGYGAGLGRPGVGSGIRVGGGIHRIPTVLSMLLVVVFGHETRGHYLRLH
jgi:hypothetical protein